MRSFNDLQTKGVPGGRGGVLYQHFSTEITTDNFRSAIIIDINANPQLTLGQLVCFFCQHPSTDAVTLLLVLPCSWKPSWHLREHKSLSNVQLRHKDAMHLMKKAKSSQNNKCQESGLTLASAMSTDPICQLTFGGVVRQLNVKANKSD